MRLERFSERGMGTNIEDIKVPNQRLVGTKNAKPHEYRNVNQKIIPTELFKTWLHNQMDLP